MHVRPVIRTRRCLWTPAALIALAVMSGLPGPSNAQTAPELSARADSTTDGTPTVSGTAISDFPEFPAFPAFLPQLLRGRFVRVGGRRVHVVDRGAGEPVVLVHGFGGWVWTFRDIVGPLSAHRRVIAVDLLGFGQIGRAHV